MPAPSGLVLGGFHEIASRIYVLRRARRTPALAEDLDFSKIGCKEFISAPKDQVSTILVWLEGLLYQGKRAPDHVADKTVKDAKNLSEYCNAHPDADVIAAAEAVHAGQIGHGPG